ncbi:hypothetical protein ACFLTT_03680 [Chloroflexota bacterium]
MYIFKTSGATFGSVIRNQKHAFANKPREWYPGELVLISKNKKDCKYNEKQIQYIMTIDNIRCLLKGEIEKLWPGNENRWKYLVECSNVKHISQPFDLKDVIGEANYNESYHGVVCYKRLPLKDENMINKYIDEVGTF